MHHPICWHPICGQNPVSGRIFRARKIHKSGTWRISQNKMQNLFVNRHRRGLETCPQANLAKMSHAIFFSFFPTGPSDEYDSAPSRKYTGQFVPFSPASVNSHAGRSDISHAGKLFLFICHIFWPFFSEISTQITLNKLEINFFVNSFDMNKGELNSGL